MSFFENNKFLPLTFNDFNKLETILSKSMGYPRINKEFKYYIDNEEMHGWFQPFKNYKDNVMEHIIQFFSNKNKNDWEIEISFYMKKKEKREKENNYYFFMTLYNKFRLNRNITIQFNFNLNKNVSLFSIKNNKRFVYFYEKENLDPIFIQVLNLLIESHYNDIIIPFVTKKRKKLNKEHYLKYNGVIYDFNTFKINNESFNFFKYQIQYLIILLFYNNEVPYCHDINKVVLPIKANLVRENIKNYSYHTSKNKDLNSIWYKLKQDNKEIMFFNMLHFTNYKKHK